MAATAVYSTSAEVLLRRQQYSVAFSNLRNPRPPLPFWKLASHRIPVLWNLYRNLLKTASGENVSSNASSRSKSDGFTRPDGEFVCSSKNTDILLVRSRRRPSYRKQKRFSELQCRSFLCANTLLISCYASSEKRKMAIFAHSGLPNVMKP